MRQPATPVHDGALLRPDAVIIAVDFDAAWRPSVFDRARQFVVDHVAHYRQFTAQGWFTGYPSDPIDLSDVLLGRANASAERMVYVNMMGIGLEDVVTAAVLVEAAEAAESARPLTDGDRARGLVSAAFDRRPDRQWPSRRAAAGPGRSHNSRQAANTIPPRTAKPVK